MRESEKQFRTMADALPVMLWTAGAEGRCTFFNRRWLEFTGRTLGEELARGWTNIVHPADLARSAAAYERSFQRQREFRLECRLRRSDGEYRRMLVCGAPQFSQAAVFAGYVGLCIDIGEIRPAHRQGVLQEKLETVGVLAGGIAHDFNNLLGGILADAELVLADLPPGSACAEHVARLRTVAIRASEIVRELMVYSGQDQGQVTDVDLSLLVEEMLALLKVSISKQARLAADLAGNLPAVPAEAAELRQLVMNLILNASDAVRATGGEIRVATSRVTITQEGAAADLAPGEYVQLDVSDTGRGMSREVRARIFDPYFSTKRSGGGLGLSVVRRIVRRYGGAIRCHTVAGEGTHFAVLLPCAGTAEPERRPAALPAAATAAPEGGGTVLLVEDEEYLRIPVSNLLRRRGFRVIEAADGEGAIEAVRDKGDSIDVMLLDLTLPGMPGTAVAAEAARIRPDLKIVLTTAYSRRAAGNALTAPQVKGFIRKPYEIRELTRLLGEILGGSHKEAAPETGILTAGTQRP